MLDLVATAKAEYAEFQALAPSRRAWLASPRLLVLPDWFMARFAGAGVIYRWTCICPKLLKAPGSVRRAVLAHEWGHVSQGHSLVTSAVVPLALAYIVSTLTMPGGNALWALANIGLLCAMLACMLFMHNPRREHEADSVAVRLLGPVAMSHGLRWVRDHMRGGVESSVMKERLERLDHMVALGRDAQLTCPADQAWVPLVCDPDLLTFAEAINGPLANDVHVVAHETPLLHAAMRRGWTTRDEVERIRAEQAVYVLCLRAQQTRMQGDALPGIREGMK